MTERVFNMLFLCSANSDRSLSTGAILNTVGGGRFHVYSAGSQPLIMAMLAVPAMLGVVIVVNASRGWYMRGV